MKYKNKTITFLLAVITLFAQPGYVAAQGVVPPANAPDRLAPAQMKNAITVHDGSPERRSASGGVYRFASCNNSVDNNTPCYIVVSGSGSFPKAVDNATVIPLASSATITCGVNIYNKLGVKVGRLQQNINVTFTGTFGQTPVKLNWGDLGGTFTIFGYTWSNLGGPTPNPNWGVTVPRTGTAYANASGMISLNVGVPLIQYYYGSRLTIRSNGWSCS